MKGLLREKKKNVFSREYVCFVSHIVLENYIIINKRDINDISSKWQFAFRAVFMNCSINPFLHCWRLRELRTAVVKTAKQMLCKQTEQN